MPLEDHPTHSGRVVHRLLERSESDDGDATRKGLVVVVVVATAAAAVVVVVIDNNAGKPRSSV